MFAGGLGELLLGPQMPAALTARGGRRKGGGMRMPMVFLQGPWKLAMGLSALDPADWLWVDDRFAAETAKRAALIVERPDEVHAMLSGAEAAASEILALARGHLAARGLPTGEERPDEPPLMTLGRLAQEDFCLMQKTAEGAYALTAAILCFPQHWRLADKIGRPMAAIHAPVPGFNAKLGTPAERLFATLTVERPVWRANWGLVEDPDLFHPGKRDPIPDLDAANAGDRLWLRVERQTLRRLPESRAVVFTIRTLIRPLAEVAADPAVALAMAQRLREIEPGMAAYKGLPLMHAPVLAYLDVCGQKAGPTPAQQHAAGRG